MAWTLTEKWPLSQPILNLRPPGDALPWTHDLTMKKLGRNNGGYFGDRIEIRGVLREIETAARDRGWMAEVFHQHGNFKWLALHRPTAQGDSPAHRIYVSTGIHGDEPAGPLAALRLIEQNAWPVGAEIVLCPCLNPVGFASGRRENEHGVELNREYLNPQSAEIAAHLRWLERQRSFALCLCLHEDWESHGFYVYELNPDHQPSLAEGIVAAVQVVCPIDRSEIIEGREATGGVIRPNLDPRTRPMWPEAFWLIMNRTRLSYTLEAPSDFSLGTRVNALVAGVNAGLEEFAERMRA